MILQARPYFSETMKITISIPNDLIEEAMMLTGAKTRKQLVREAIEERIKPLRRKKLLLTKGEVDLAIDLDELRNRK